MKKNILSFIAVLSLGLAVNAQTFEIYEGATSTTDISGTTVTVNISTLKTFLVLQLILKLDV